MFGVPLLAVVVSEMPRLLAQITFPTDNARLLFGGLWGRTAKMGDLCATNLLDSI